MEQQKDMACVGDNLPKVALPVKIFQPYTSERRANHAASFRLGHRQRVAVGEYFWTHPDVPNIAFPTRKAALAAAINKAMTTP